MAGRISGITIEIDGNTTKLSQALQGVNKDIKTTQTNLKDINRLLKFDGGNVTLLKQKQEQLNTAITKVKERLKQEQEALRQLRNGDQTPEVKAQMEALERQIEADNQELKRLTDQMKKFGSVAGQQMKAAGQKMKEFGDKMKAVGQSITSVGKDLTMKVTMPLALFGASAVKSFAEVDKIMTLTNATMGNTEAEAKLLSDAMKDAAANSTFGMTDAATATLNFARAGLTAEEAAAALAPAMNLAAGEGGNLDTVSAGLVATINSFQDTFDNASKYADVFANACNNTALDVDSLSEAMSVAAPVFNAAGYSVNDAALYMGVMANAGIKADKAANSLKTGISRLVSPTKEAKTWMDKLGFSITDENGQMKDSVTVQKELHDAFGQLSESEQIAAASAIFGKNQMSPWLALINTAPEEVDALSTALEQEGTASDMAAQMMSGFGGSLEKLKSSIDVAKVSFGEALAPTIQMVSDKIQQLVDWFNSLDSTQQQTIAKIALVVAAVGPVLVIIGSVISAIGTIISVGGTLLSVLGTVVATIGGPLTIAIAAAIALAALIITHWDQVKEMASKLATWVVEKWNQLKEGVKTAVENMKNSVKSKWAEIKSAVQEFCNNIKTFVSESWTAIKEKVSTVMDAIKSTVTQKWNDIKSKVSSVIDNIKTTISNKWDAIKTKLSSVYDSINTLTGNKLDTMKNKIQSAFDRAKEIVSSAVQRLKELVNFEWSLPHIKLPHFSISGTFSLNPPSVPHISVSWYRKAYDNPIMFTRPTVIPTANGLKGFGDGHGAEVVLGMDKLRELAGGTVINNITVNPSPGMDERTLAERVADAIQFRVDAQGAVWA